MKTEGNLRNLIPALITLLITLTAQTCLAAVLYTKETATGTGDCSSWDDACTLQTALTSGGDEIWVMEGTHTPGTTRADSFELVSGVGVYGGFAGDESVRDDRDPDTYQTILSGDIAGDDSQNPIADLDSVTGNTTNSYHVVTADGTDSTAVLDGFTITGGYANGSGEPDNAGGGILNMTGSPTLTDLIVIGNLATYAGGGLINYSDSGEVSSPSLTNVTFSGNEAEYGGGVCNVSYSGESSPSLVNVTFSGNTAYDGGGMYNYGDDGVCTPSLSSVTFSDNTADNDGGGMYNWGYDYGESSPSLEDVMFSGNTAEDGGAMYNFGEDYGTSSPSLKDVTFSDNEALEDGGGMFNESSYYSESSPSVEDVTFSGNTAEYGGAMYNFSEMAGDSSPTLVTVTFSDNETAYDGGAMFNESWLTSVSSPSLNDVTFSGNKADYGGAMLNFGYGEGVSSPTLVNVTFSDNQAAEDGGAMLNYADTDGEGSPTFEDVTFSGNTAGNDGGAMINLGDEDGVSSPTLVDVTFSDNEADDDGGAMYNESYSTGVSSPSLEMVFFFGNTAHDSGGALYNHCDTDGTSEPVLENVIFSGNKAADHGGAMSNFSNDDGLCAPELTNVTFSENSASRGGAIANYVEDGGTSSPNLNNVILWGNTASMSGSQIYNDSGTPVINYSLIEDGDGGSNSGTAFSDGTGNLDADPLFVDADGADDLAGTDDDDLSLQVGSPAIGTGNDSDYPATDILGVTRPQGEGCDIGAYEAEPMTETTLTSSKNPSKYNQTVTFTATVTGDGTPTGTVDFTREGKAICSAVTLSGGQATCDDTIAGSGEYTITATYSGDGTYDASSGTLEQDVNKLSQTITFDALSDKIYGDADFTISASASSGLTVSFTSDTPSACTVSDTTVSLVAPGTCTITASQSGSSKYRSASDVSQSFNVGQSDAGDGGDESGKYTVTVNSTGSGNGTVTSNTGEISFYHPDTTLRESTALDAGTTVILTATADTGFVATWDNCEELEGVAEGNNTSTATCTFASLDSDEFVTTVFASELYTVSATMGTNGSLDSSTPSPRTVEYGGTAQFTFNADNGYHIESISGCGIYYMNGDNAITTDTVTTDAVTEDCTVSATFAINAYQLSVTVQGKGYVTSDIGAIDCPGTCEDDYDANATVTLTPTPESGAEFIGWSGDEDCEDGVVTMTADVDCRAEFYSFPWAMFIPAITGNGGQ